MHPLAADTRPLAPRRGGWSPDGLLARRLAPRLPCETPLVWIALAVGAGAAIESVGRGSAVGPLGLYFVAGCLLLGWLTAWRGRRDHGSAALLLLAVGVLAGGWSGQAWRWCSAVDLGRYASRDAEPVCFDGIVACLPERRPVEPGSPFRAIPSSERTVLTVDATHLRDGIVWQSVAGRCEVTVRGQPTRIEPGDRVRIFGQLRLPTPALNPGQRDSAARARSEGRLCFAWSEAPECVSVLSEIEPMRSTPARWAASLNTRFASVLDRTMPPRQAAIARAMLLGDLSRLPRETVEAFRWTGTLHLLVVSGLHVGLVASPFLLMLAVGWAPKRAALIGAIVVTLVYAAATGGRPPAVRAAIIVSSACAAALAGRRPLGANSLACAAVAVFVASPGAWLAVGTRLSFMAAATLLGIAQFAARSRCRALDPIDRLVSQYRPWPERIVRRATSSAGWILAATVAVVGVSWPLLASEFHLISPAAVPLSLMTSLLVLFTVLGGVFLAASEWLLACGSLLLGETLTSAVIGPLQSLAASVCGASAELLAATVERAAAVPYAGSHTAGLPGWWTGFWFVAIAALAAAFAYTSKWLWLAPRLALLLLAAAAIPVLNDSLAEQRELRISFLAVGHGSSVLIETPDGRALLYDAGALASPDRTADTIARALWARGIHRLGGVFLSHPDVDHYNALPGLLERFPTAGVWTTTRMFPRADDSLDWSGPAELKRLLRARGVPIHELRMGDRLSLGGVAFEVLHPDQFGVIGSDNANSLVLAAEFEGKRVLLTGDLESPGLDRLLQTEPYPCDLLATPHHGSVHSDPPGLAAWCRPRLAVISSGSLTPATGLAYEREGASVLNTHQTGMVTVSLSEQRLSWSVFSASDPD